jgi:hypothetical protein
MMSWVLQYLVGFQQLGHDVYFVEKSGYPNSCYDPVKNVMSDDCSYGTKTLSALLERFGLQEKWCYVDAAEDYHGLSREEIEGIFPSAELFVDMGTHGAWLLEAVDTGVRVLIDGEPGFTQMKMEKRLTASEALPEYDFYYTTGRNIGTAKSTAPTTGKVWRHLFHPVAVDLFNPCSVTADAPFTTVMNWQSYEPVSYNGVTYGHKDVEFWKFIDLPKRTSAMIEVAVSGKQTPADRLIDAGWHVRDAHDVTMSFDTFVTYIRNSKGEFSVCKNGYVATNCGWFSDRSAAYLASGRPVVMQDTGFSDHLPCGRGLLAVHTVDEAAAAIDEINSDYEAHSRWGREIADGYLDTRTVLGRLLNELGVS